MNFIDIALIIRTKIAYMLAYFPVVTLAGFLQAWFLNLVGDSKAKDEGYMSLNPMNHFDTYGFFILLFPWQLLGIDINIGFGKMLPNDLDGIIVSKYNFFRRALIIFSTAISYLLATLIFLSLSFVVALILIKFGASYIDLTSDFENSIMLVSRCIASLAIELFFVFFVINLVDLILYKFDTTGFIKNNPIFRFLFIILLASIILPLVKIMFIYLFGKLILASIA